MSDVSAQAARLLGEEVLSSDRLHGGDLSEVRRLRLASGPGVVAKTGGAARVEADMLRAIAGTGATAPAILAVTDDLLLMEDLGQDGGLAGAWADLGHVLRRLHAATGDTYGWKADYGFGAVRLDNAPTASWPEFWAERRLRPTAAPLPRDLRARVEGLCGRLDDLLPQRPPPALLHGDLWSGNIVTDGARVTGLVDPACYYGHFEVDLAMLSLFASPPEAFRRAYGAAEAGADDRRPVYQLWPALVHLRLFGSGYRGMVERLLSRLE